MPINVTCPSCLKRFSVSDKFAGKTGPCPNCQKTIKVPELSEQVVIHAPEADSPKDASGKAILSPIRREEVNVSLPIIIGSCVAALCIFVLALGLRITGNPPQVALLTLGAIIIAPPLVFLGYWFLHDDELEGFAGQQLLLRVVICGISFALIWALYVFVPAFVFEYESTAEYSALALGLSIPAMLVLGAAIAVAALELEAVQGLMHYSLYFIVTFALAWLSGAPLAAPLGGETKPRPAVSSPGGEGTDQAPVRDETKPDISKKVLQ